MEKCYDFAVIGGDKRMAYMAESLVEAGYKVIGYGLDKGETYSGLEEAATLKGAVLQAKIVIGPIPLSRDGERILAKEALPDLKIEVLKEHLTSEQMFFAGCLSPALKAFGTDKKISMYDYMSDEELTIFNTIATAEGAIAEAIAHQPTNLHGSRSLIIGYGRCARTLAGKLNGLSADTTICARRNIVREEASANGCHTIKMEELEEKISRFEYIFNTAPDMVLGRNVLNQVRKEAIIIDIASSPGGVDFEYAREKGIQAKLSLGLPGIYAPKASAEALIKVTLEKV